MKAAILPRFFAPNKMKGGDTKLFNAYSGQFVDENTVMVLRLFTEAYIEFSKNGAVLYVFFLYNLWFIFEKVKRFFKDSANFDSVINFSF